MKVISLRLGGKCTIYKLINLCSDMNIIGLLGARRSARKQMEAMQRQTQQVQSQPTASTNTASVS